MLKLFGDCLKIVGSSLKHQRQKLNFISICESERMILKLAEQVVDGFRRSVTIPGQSLSSIEYIISMEIALRL